MCSGTTVPLCAQITNTAASAIPFGSVFLNVCMLQLQCVLLITPWLFYSDISMPWVCPASDPYLELTGAAVLYEWRERSQLQLGVRLQHVADQVGHLGDVVSETLAHADPDRVAGHFLHLVAERLHNAEGSDEPGQHEQSCPAERHHRPGQGSPGAERVPLLAQFIFYQKTGSDGPGRRNACL